MKIQCLLFLLKKKKVNLTHTSVTKEIALARKVVCMLCMKSYTVSEFFLFILLF